jgi:predicted aminopeptidase
MLPEAGRYSDGARPVALAALALACLALPGCYLMHVTAGQLELNWARRPIAEVIADPATPEAVRERLDYVGRARRFASDALALPDNGTFTGYVELDRPYVVWNVFAAPEFSVEPRTWCFPIAGCVAYRGYFDEAQARDYASRLRGEGYDVYLAPVAAYSTLGHFDDPILSTMLRYDEIDLAALIFHELAHQEAYVPGDSAFNESFATTVELEGVRRWLESLHRADELAAFQQARGRLVAVTDLMAEARQRLAGVYSSGLSADEMRKAKKREFDRLKRDYQVLRAGWEHSANLDQMMAAELNNARLAAVSTYHECVPGFTRLLAEVEFDLPAFYRAVRQAGRETEEARAARVCQGASAAGAAAKQGVPAASALESEVVRDDRLHRLGLDSQPREAADRADAVHAE